MIKLIGVVKEFQPRLGLRRAPVRALDGIDLAVEPGTALGIVGLNGAGKSTLLRLLMGYARATAGELAIDGVQPRHYVSRHGVAYVPERVSVQRSWTVRHALRAFAMLGGIADDPWGRVEWSIDRLGLGGLADRKVAALSKGNLQRLAIAQAILPNRKLMVLDEPTDGLDPVWIVELRAIVAEWRAADPARVLVLASHALPEVERLTDRVLLLHNGRFEGELKGPGEAASLEDRFLSRVTALPEARA